MTGSEFAQRMPTPRRVRESRPFVDCHPYPKTLHSDALEASSHAAHCRPQLRSERPKQRPWRASFMLRRCCVWPP